MDGKEISSNTPTPVNAPSLVWSGWLEDLRFLRLLEDKDLRLHVGFGYYLGAPIEKDLWVASEYGRPTQSQLPRPRIVHDYQELVAGVPDGFWVSEPDPLRERMSVPLVESRIYWINTDTVRTQVDITNLYNLGLLDDAARDYVEVGGGYGRLAQAVLKSSPASTYTIVDFPEILDTVRRRFALACPEIPVYTGHQEDFDLVQTNRGSLRLISNESRERELDCDVLINVNSFFEMTNAQVLDYIESGRIRWRQIYSNNRERQPDNFQLTSPLTELLGRVGELWPESVAGQSYGAAGGSLERIEENRKLVLVVSHHGHSWTPPIRPQQLQGIARGYMPAVFS